MIRYGQYGQEFPQIYAYDAHGNPLSFTPTLALTTHLDDREQTDHLAGLQYLRARYYNPATGTFNRLDPFAGNFSDPQSLHKYLYTHGDPVNAWDPTGRMQLFGMTLGVKMVLAVAAVCIPILVATQWMFWTKSGNEWQNEHLNVGAALARSSARRKGPDKIRLFKTEAAVISDSSGIYTEASLPSILDQYATIYPDVTNRRCDIALGDLENQLEPWVAAHSNLTRGIKFVEADWQKIPIGQDAELGLEDDNILILVPTEYWEEVRTNPKRMADPAWYDSSKKRDIIYFYPGSSPINPVNRLYNEYVRYTNNQYPNDPSALPHLNVHPGIVFPRESGE